MGGELGRVGAWPLPRRQPVGTTGPVALRFRPPPTEANDQTFRLIVRPTSGAGRRAWLHQCFGTKPITFDGAFIGLQLGGPGLVKGTNRPVTFGGKESVTVAPGSTVWSDPVELFRARSGARRRSPDANSRSASTSRAERPDDLPREGAGHVIRHRTWRRIERRG